MYALKRLYGTIASSGQLTLAAMSTVYWTSTSDHSEKDGDEEVSLRLSHPSQASTVYVEELPWSAEALKGGSGCTSKLALQLWIDCIDFCHFCPFRLPHRLMPLSCSVDGTICRSIVAEGGAMRGFVVDVGLCWLVFLASTYARIVELGEFDPSIVYDGDWSIYRAPELQLRNSVIHTRTEGARATLTFRGDVVWLVTSYAVDGASAEITVDGKNVCSGARLLLITAQERSSASSRPI